MRCGSELLIFDLGSGVRLMGEAHPRPIRASVFLSHYHWDHLQGLPFFSPITEPGNQFVVYGPTRNGRTVQQILAGQMQQPYFPVSADALIRAQVAYRPFSEGQTLRLGEAVVRALELNHPGGNLGYRVDFRNRSLVYATDIEHGTDADDRMADFARNADLLIYDAMYTEDEYLGRLGPPRSGWGHSTWRGAVDAAQRSGAKKLVLFHHEPTRDDQWLDRVVRTVRRYHSDAIAARESQILYL